MQITSNEGKVCINIESKQRSKYFSVLYTGTIIDTLGIPRLLNPIPSYLKCVNMHMYSFKEYGIIKLGLLYLLQNLSI